MEMEKRGFQGQAADRTALDLIHAGPLAFAIEYRFVGGEQGPSIHVFGPRDGVEEEILRFDCFDKIPHFHYGFSYIDQPMVPIDPVAVGNPLDWVCDQIENNLPDMLTKADAKELTKECDAQTLSYVADTLKNRASTLDRTKPV